MDHLVEGIDWLVDEPGRPACLFVVIAVALGVAECFLGSGYAIIGLVSLGAGAGMAWADWPLLVPPAEGSR